MVFKLCRMNIFHIFYKGWVKLNAFLSKYFYEILFWLYLYHVVDKYVIFKIIKVFSTDNKELCNFG
jgi:hypothetical protein